MVKMEGIIEVQWSLTVLCACVYERERETKRIGGFFFFNLPELSFRSGDIFIGILKLNPYCEV